VRFRPAARIADAIFADVEAFAAGSQPSDDRTLVVIKRPGPTPS
jgi:serine phosphatase RsbU (regulator of sigma subunit)